MRSRHAVSLARKNLCNIIDVPLTKEIVLTTAADSVAETAIDLDTAVRNGIARRPELAAIACRKLMARKEIETNRNGYLPTVSFFADLSYMYPDRNYAKDFNSSWKLGVVAQMNLFDWGRTVYQTRQSRSRLIEIETTERSIRDAITLDVTRAYLTLLDAWDAIQVARDGLAQANENHRVTFERFKEGLATNTDLLDAEVLLTASARASTSGRHSGCTTISHSGCSCRLMSTSPSVISWCVGQKPFHDIISLSVCVAR
jgi:outer membrane protein